MRKTLVKTPFEFSDLNSYLWNKQGKKHYWGIQGKDYGLIQSPEKKYRKHPEQILPEIRHEHMNFNPFLAKSPIKSEKYHLKQLPQYQQTQILKKGKNFRQYDNQKFVNQVHCQTEPIQQLLSPQLSHTNHLKSNRKAHLSLLTKILNNKAQERDSLQIEKDKMQNRDTSISKREHNNYSLRYQQKTHQGRERIKSEMNNYNGNQYKDRIVRVVRKDRRNSPTFCNSLAYPLPCYQYIQ